MTNVELTTLKKALLIIGLEEVNKYKNSTDEDVAFSNEFEEAISNINKKRKSIIHRATKTVPRRIAFVFIAAVITFCLLMSISAIRRPVLNFFVNIYDNFIEVVFDEDETAVSSETNESNQTVEDDYEVYVPEVIEKVYLPSYMIEGYSLVDFLQFEDIAETYWDDGYNLIILYQEIMEEEFRINLDNIGSGYTKATIDNKIIYYIINKGEYMLLWTDGSYMYTLILPEDIPMTEIEKIITSME